MYLLKLLLNLLELPQLLLSLLLPLLELLLLPSQQHQQLYLEPAHTLLLYFHHHLLSHMVLIYNVDNLPLLH